MCKTLKSVAETLQDHLGGSHGILAAIPVVQRDLEYIELVIEADANPHLALSAAQPLANDCKLVLVYPSKLKRAEMGGVFRRPLQFTCIRH